MNIYLDIDGVLLANENHPAAGADQFIDAILNKYPSSTFWLTTHCWHGLNRTEQILKPFLLPHTQSLLQFIKPTDWGELKTDAIDFTKPFLWFDDDLMQEENIVLEQHKSFNGYIRINLQQNPKQLITLTSKYFQ